VLALGIGGVYLSSDGGARTVHRLEYSAHQQRWDSVLKLARRVPARRYGLLVNMTVNWALSHQGQLPYALFAYRQYRLGLLRHPDEFFLQENAERPLPSPLEFMRSSDIFYALGCVNEAEHMASEALEDQGYRPWILERLAMAKIVKREPEAARRYLMALSKDLIYGQRGADLLKRLEQDPLLSSDPDVQRARALMVTQDKPTPDSVEAILLELLARNRQNKMAFEYLMALHLLAKDPKAVARDIGRLGDFAYPQVPALYEEAIVVYHAVTETPVDGVRWVVSQEAVRRCGEFNRIVEACRGDRNRALRALAKDYRASFFPYYFLFPGSEAE